jgi:hypothetical protein
MQDAKRCPRCKQVKPASQYWRYLKDRYSPNGALHELAGRLQTYCKTCHAEYRRQRKALKRQQRQNAQPIEP